MQAYRSRRTVLTALAGLVGVAPLRSIAGACFELKPANDEAIVEQVTVETK
jgi:hypothetical protein